MAKPFAPPKGFSLNDIVMTGKFAGMTYAQRADALREKKSKREKARRARRRQEQIDAGVITPDKPKPTFADKVHLALANSRKKDKAQQALEKIEAHAVPEKPKDKSRAKWKQYLEKLRANKQKHQALLRASQMLAEELPGLKLSATGEIEINKLNLRMLYDKSFEEDMIGDLDEDDDIGDERPAWSPLKPVITYLKAYFKIRPFDKIRFGILKIVDRYGEACWFEVNREQDIMLTYLEERWYAEMSVRVIVLKARQIGSSTLWQGVHYCYQSTQSNKHSHIVADLKEKCDGFMEMFNNFYESEPAWMRPNIHSRNPLKFHGNGVANARIRIESAERRENISRAFSFQFNHLSEIPFWPEKEMQSIFNALLKAIPDKWPCIHIEESTGRSVNDMFYTRYFDAKRGSMGPSYKAFFFPWFEHEEYQLELPGNLSEAEFRSTLNDEDLERWSKYGLTAQQMYWYVTERSGEISSSDKNDEMFCREYPSNEEEAFLGGNSNFFDVKRNSSDKERCSSRFRRRAETLDGLKKSVSGFLAAHNWKAIYPFVRCGMNTDVKNLCANPEFETDERNGLWTVWEAPRLGHQYVITADSALGKEAQKNISTSTDYDVCDVWRITHEHDEPRMFVLVAQLRARIGPIELAAHAVAASRIYRNQMDADMPALVIGENNAHGFAFCEEAKRLGANQYQRIDYGKNGEVMKSELGFRTTGGDNAKGAKSHLLNRFRRVWNNDMVLILSEATTHEMGVFINKDGSLEAMRPHHDDTVIAAALFIEAVYSLTGEMQPIEVHLGPSLDGLEDEDLLDIPEIVDVHQFRAALHERMGLNKKQVMNRRDSKRWF